MLRKSDFLYTWNPSLTCQRLEAELLLYLFAFLLILIFCFSLHAITCSQREYYCLCRVVNVRSCRSEQLSVSSIVWLSGKFPESE